MAQRDRLLLFVWNGLNNLNGLNFLHDLNESGGRHHGPSEEFG